MSFPSKKIDRGDFSACERGSAFMVVITFTAIAMVTIFSYLIHQTSMAKPSLRSPSSLQALFNARSGIYRALYELIDSTETDTLPTISTLDSTFGSSMFFGVLDTAEPVSGKIQLDGTPVVYDTAFPPTSL